MNKINGHALVFIVLFIALGLWSSLSAYREEIPLEDLYPAGEGQRYQELIRSIRAQPVGEDGFKFVVLGDTRSNFGKAMEVMTAAAGESPRFILHTGDVVRRGRVEEYISHHLPLVEAVSPVPVLPIPGNHEEGPNGDFAAFLHLYGEDHFAFDFGDCHFVAFNNCEGWGLTGSHLKFLDESLSNTDARYKFVMFHLPPEKLDVYVDTEEGRGFRKNWGNLRELMTRHDVTHVYMGHVHGYATTTVDGVPYTITGGGGANLAEQLDEEGSVHNYLVVEVGPSGVSTEVVREVGDTWVRSAL